MIHSPTCARPLWSVTSASAAANCCPAAASNLRAARRHSSARFLAAPLLGPLPHGFRQHRAHLLQPRQRRRGCPPQPPRQQHLLGPGAERVRQLLVVLRPQQPDQRVQQRRQPRPVPVRLQRNQRRHQVARRQRAAVRPAFVKQEVLLRRLIPRQSRPAGRDQTPPRPPSPSTVTVRCRSPPAAPGAAHRARAARPRPPASDTATRCRSASAPPSPGRHRTRAAEDTATARHRTDAPH